MSLLSKIIPSPGRGKSYSDAPAGSSSSMYSWGLSSLAGEVVSPASAAQLAAVFCAVKILSETIGMVSLDMYSREDGIIKTLPKHPLQFRLHDEPNSDQTAMEWREQMTGSLALWGNAFSRKIIRGSRLAGLEALSPQAMSVRKDRGDRVFRYYPLDGARLRKILPPRKSSISGRSAGMAWRESHLFPRSGMPSAWPWRWNGMDRDSSQMAHSPGEFSSIPAR